MGRFLETQNVWLNFFYYVSGVLIVSVGVSVTVAVASITVSVSAVHSINRLLKKTTNIFG